MARPAKLKLWLLLGLVLAVHLAGLEWFARRHEEAAALPTITPPMFTRILQQAAPPPLVAEAAPPPAPKPRPGRAVAAPRPLPRASEPLPDPPEVVAQETPQPQTPLQHEGAPYAPAIEPGAEPEPPQAARPAAAASAAAAAASPPVAAASAAASAPGSTAASAPDASAQALAGWPADTRLSYRLEGQFRGGPLFGTARVQWQRKAENYQVRLDIDIKYFTTFAMTSQGEVTPGGLMPRAYEEYRPGKRRTASFGPEFLTMENGKTAPRPAGVQDTASQFVELAHRFATGRAVLEVGRTVTLPLARPGGLDEWTYDIVEREMLRTPTLGTVEAFHLKPRPIVNPRGNITAEMWFAPSLQYLPVRIKVLMGEDTYLDLLVERIEQR